MAVTVEWDNDEKTRIYFRHMGEWTWQEAVLAHDEAVQMLRTVKHPVDMIVDLRESYKLPPGALSQLGNAAKRAANIPNFGIIVTIGADRLVHMMADMFRKVYENLVVDTFFVHDRGEARDVIIRYREENRIPDLGDS